MKRLTKQEMVLEIYDREAMGEVTAREIAVINQGLIEEFGEGGAMAPAEIARILRAEDLPVRYEQIFRMESPTDKYENLFGGLTACGTLSEAEATLKRIDELYRQFQQAGDRTGVRFARQAAQRIKRHASALSQSPKTPPPGCKEAEEIAQWATIWLQSPDLFAPWMALRKATAEFRNLFGVANSPQKNNQNQNSQQNGDK
ncbi:MAG TPA: hypothetical protein PKC13_22255 [Blastocatellia bacterium]|nr:hypothetical protein [Blastocatellia bacterium]HMX28327.1 hypothetical protein [Blastocatellia bacterium]